MDVSLNACVPGLNVLTLQSDNGNRAVTLLWACDVMLISVRENKVSSEVLKSLRVDFCGLYFIEISSRLGVWFCSMIQESSPFPNLLVGLGYLLDQKHFYILQISLSPGVLTFLNFLVS